MLIFALDSLLVVTSYVQLEKCKSSTWLFLLNCYKQGSIFDNTLSFLCLRQQLMSLPPYSWLIISCLVLFQGSTCNGCSFTFRTSLIGNCLVIYWNKECALTLSIYNNQPFFVLTVPRIIAVHSLKGKDPIVFGSDFVVVICYSS